MATDKSNIIIEAGLSNAQAWALAQFLKRVSWSEIRGCAVDNNEAYLIRDSLELLRDNLTEQGCNPR